MLKRTIVCSVLYKAEGYAERLDFLVSALVIKEQLMACVSSTLFSELDQEQTHHLRVRKTSLLVQFLEVCKLRTLYLCVNERRISFKNEECTWINFKLVEKLYCRLRRGALVAHLGWDEK